MGDRANVVILPAWGDSAPVWFYTHWSGHELPDIVAAGLVRGANRWGDTSYLARIIFCEMVKGHEADETGFGISTEMHDNEYPVIVVDDKNQEVRVIPEGADPANRDAPAWPTIPYKEATGSAIREMRDGRR